MSQYQFRKSLFSAVLLAGFATTSLAAYAQGNPGDAQNGNSQMTTQENQKQPLRPRKRLREKLMNKIRNKEEKKMEKKMEQQAPAAQPNPQ